ncbi:MAG TPA: hypothetical protein PKG49_08890 [Nitrosomonas mobilis]|nr:hypothetical protein [Nitrosomonas mobilis]
MIVRLTGKSSEDSGLSVGAATAAHLEEEVRRRTAISGAPRSAPTTWQCYPQTDVQISRLAPRLRSIPFVRANSAVNIQRHAQLFRLLL